MRGPRFAWGVGAFCVVVTISGCPEPGELEDAGTLPEPPSTPQVDDVESTCETSCVSALFGARGCSVCHTKDAPAAFSELDLASPQRARRLRDVPAKHLGDPPLAGPCPTNDRLIDSTAPANSWLLKKVLGQHDTCGGPMPGKLLEGADLECVKTYVTCVAAAR